jgi:hypothetical protein
VEIEQPAQEDNEQPTTPAVWTVCEPPHENDGIGQKRTKYICEIEVYLPLVQAALHETQTLEPDQARILNNLRRTIGKRYKDLTPTWLRSFIYCRNQKKYKDPWGPTYESLSSQGKKDAEIIKSAMRTGGKDLYLDSRVVVAVSDFLNYMNWGPAVDAAWQWIPGQTCPSID